MVDFAIVASQLVAFDDVRLERLTAILPLRKEGIGEDWLDLFAKRVRGAHIIRGRLQIPFA